jgi:TDG/mug DNA glycosylase family protein
VTDVLSDLLQHSLRIVLCGTAAGTTSAVERAYYAHRQNKFWKVLHETGLTQELLRPHQFRTLLQYRIGLTDLVKAGAGMDRATLPKLTVADRARLRNAIATFRPQFLAFTSKTAGQKFFGGKREYGEQVELFGDTRVWILPSTSGAANGSWRPEIWQQFADKVRAAVG